VGLLSSYAPVWLVVACAVLALLTTAIWSLAGPLRAVEALLNAVAGVLRACNRVRVEWRSLRSPAQAADPRRDERSS
jgi:hypothetical protein